MIKFPSIDQFRTVVKNVKHKAQNSESKFDRFCLFPSLKFFGTVKLHGTNASIVQEAQYGGLQYQSRERIITPEDDNAGFALYMSAKEYYLNTYLDSIRAMFKVKRDTCVTVYGEWCGGNIQKNVAINDVEKMFVVFAVRIGVDEETQWIRADNTNFSITTYSLLQIYSIGQFFNSCYEVTVDFNNPEEAQNKFVELTKAIEKECPIGACFGIKGTGEGIVWHCIDEEYRSSDYVFKTKGDKHSASKVKVIAAVDVERISKIKDLVSTIVTENRMNQMLEGIEVDIKNTGKFVKAVIADSVKEEMDTILENGFEIKEFVAYAGTVASAWFRSRGI